MTVYVSAEGRQGVSRRVSLLNLRSLLTIMIKTFDRMDKVFRLVDSIRARYPDVPIIVSDDGEGAAPMLARHPGGVHMREFLFLPLPYDAGLSAGRNAMLDHVTTPYVLTLDDDFLLDADGAVEHLLWPILQGSRDLVAGKSPADEARYGFDYVGLLAAVGETLELIGASRGEMLDPSAGCLGCLEADIVPNIFVASTARLRQIRWDPALKLGEHEEFFLRAKQAGMRVASAPLVAFKHVQDPSWQANKNGKYNSMRARVSDFWKVALRKHGFTRLVSFGHVVMDLIRTENSVRFSVRFVGGPWSNTRHSLVCSPKPAQDAQRDRCPRDERSDRLGGRSDAAESDRRQVHRSVLRRQPAGRGLLGPDKRQ